ncbi:hypothetical protein N9D63_01640 [Opitutales bacterium]|nr:hypothetical protein [Opitutales bacterium]
MKSQKNSTGHLSFVLMLSLRATTWRDNPVVVVTWDAGAMRGLPDGSGWIAASLRS